jgi:hypothetical protein
MGHELAPRISAERPTLDVMQCSASDDLILTREDGQPDFPAATPRCYSRDRKNPFDPMSHMLRR